MFDTFYYFVSEWKGVVWGFGGVVWNIFNTSKNIYPIAYVEFTMDCKVICGFNLSNGKKFHCFDFPIT